MKRAIVLFPKCNNLDVIQAIRERYDPLAAYIAPHITLVFPFESDMTTEELKRHMDNALKGAKKFVVGMRDITGDFRDGYLFLNVKQGNDEIIDLHDRLYTDTLESLLLRSVTYCPHMTVGRVERHEFNDALEELKSISELFEAQIDQIVVENIDLKERSTIEIVFHLS